MCQSLLYTTVNCLVQPQILVVYCTHWPIIGSLWYTSSTLMYWSSSYLCIAIYMMYMRTFSVCPPCTIAECIQGVLPAETVNLCGPSSRNAELYSTIKSSLFVFPSMNFSCDGTITDIRMRMQFVSGLPADSNITQEVVVNFLLFHDELNSPTRRVTHILLNQTNTQQELPNEIWTNSDPLSLPVTEGSFIGFAVPDNRSPTTFTKGINFSPTSERVETHFYRLTASFSEFEGRVLEAARIANSSQFTTAMIHLPLIEVSFSE